MHKHKKWTWVALATLSVLLVGGFYYADHNGSSNCVSYYDKDGATLLYKECE